MRCSPPQPGSVPRNCSLVEIARLLQSIAKTWGVNGPHVACLPAAVRRSWEGAELEIKVAGAQSRHVGAPPRSVPGCGS